MANQNVFDDLPADSEQIDRVVATAALAAFAAMARKAQRDFDDAVDRGLVQHRAPTTVALLVRWKAERDAECPP